MPFTIIKENRPDRVIRMGRADAVAPDGEPKEQGRTQMPEERELGKETGVKKIHEEDASKQGPVGTGAERQPARDTEADVKIGGKEERENG